MPVNIIELFTVLEQAQQISLHLRSQAIEHKDSKAGKFLATLDQLAFTKYHLCYDKWKTVNFFFAKPKRDDFSSKAKDDLAKHESRHEAADKYQQHVVKHHFGF